MKKKEEIFSEIYLLT